MLSLYFLKLIYYAKLGKSLKLNYLGVLLLFISFRFFFKHFKTHSSCQHADTVLFAQGQHNDDEHGGDFISEARDWAGELISAQTMMGKILVSIMRILMV